jgi:hypothetical protein
MLTAKCKDRNVKMFWEKQYDEVPKDASVVVLSCIVLFRSGLLCLCLWLKKVVLIFGRLWLAKDCYYVLSEGKGTPDILNFLGCLFS